MNRNILIILLLIIITVSCRDRTVTTSLIHKIVAKNKTDKKLLIKFTIGMYHSKGNDMHVSADTLYGERRYSFGAYGEDPIAQIPISYSIQSLADTTSYIYIEYEDDVNLLEPYIVSDYKDVDNHNAILTKTLTISEETLTILEKDYSMLEEFPEYYNK